jgi:hypothetical protein
MDIVGDPGNSGFATMRNVLAPDASLRLVRLATLERLYGAVRRGGDVVLS